MDRHLYYEMTCRDGCRPTASSSGARDDRGANLPYVSDSLRERDAMRIFGTNGYLRPGYDTGRVR